MIANIGIGTRDSKLALWQAEWVKERIVKQFPAINIQTIKIKTKGDKIQDVALDRIGGKGFFVKEIEEALLNGRIDLAVHSMKDVPTKMPDPLHIGAITEREDPRDAMISDHWKYFNELPIGARVGTSSLRRQSQILHARQDLKMVVLRGNLDTRLRKLKSEGLDAIIVAACGMIRLGEQDKITEYLDLDFCLPAIGQGTFGLECRKEDHELNEILSTLNEPDISGAVRAERAFLERLEGGCNVPIAGYGELFNGTLRLKGLIGSIDGRDLIKDEISGNSDEPELLGRMLAEKLLNSGGKAILKKTYADLS